MLNIYTISDLWQVPLKLNERNYWSQFMDNYPLFSKLYIYIYITHTKDEHIMIVACSFSVASIKFGAEGYALAPLLLTNLKWHK